MRDGEGTQGRARASIGLKGKSRATNMSPLHLELQAASLAVHPWEYHETRPYQSWVLDCSSVLWPVVYLEMPCEMFASPIECREPP